jgi:hypothetical protein
VARSAVATILTLETTVLTEPQEKTEITERRFRMLYIEPRSMLRIMNLAREDDGAAVVLPTFPLLPDGYTLINVSLDYQRHGFAFLLAHPSWSRVLHGEIPPDINGSMECVHVSRSVVKRDDPAASKWRKEKPLL